MPEEPEQKPDEREPIGFHTGGTQRLGVAANTPDTQTQGASGGGQSPPERVTGQWGAAGFRDNMLIPEVDLSNVHEAPTAVQETPAAETATAAIAETAPLAEPEPPATQPIPERVKDSRFGDFEEILF